MFSPVRANEPENAKSPATRGFRTCAEEDSNLHPVIPDQALNLARLPIPPSARGLAEYSRAGRPRSASPDELERELAERFEPVVEPLTRGDGKRRDDRTGDEDLARAHG